MPTTSQERSVASQMPELPTPATRVQYPVFEGNAHHIYHHAVLKVAFHRYLMVGTVSVIDTVV